MATARENTQLTELAHQITDLARRQGGVEARVDGLERDLAEFMADTRRHRVDEERQWTSVNAKLDGILERLARNQPTIDRAKRMLWSVTAIGSAVGIVIMFFHESIREWILRQLGGRP